MTELTWKQYMARQVMVRAKQWWPDGNKTVHEDEDGVEYYIDATHQLVRRTPAGVYTVGINPGDFIVEHRGWTQVVSALLMSSLFVEYEIGVDFAAPGTRDFSVETPSDAIMSRSSVVAENDKLWDEIASRREPAGIEADETLDLVLRNKDGHGDHLVIRSDDIHDVMKVLTMEEGRPDPCLRTAGKSLVGRLLILVEALQADVDKVVKDNADIWAGEAERRKALAAALGSTSTGWEQMTEVATALYERASKVPDGPVGAISDPSHKPSFTARPTKMGEVPDDHRAV